MSFLDSACLSPCSTRQLCTGCGADRSQPTHSCTITTPRCPASRASTSPAHRVWYCRPLMGGSLGPTCSSAAARQQQARKQQHRLPVGFHAPQDEATKAQAHLRELCWVQSTAGGCQPPSGHRSLAGCNQQQVVGNHHRDIQTPQILLWLSTDLCHPSREQGFVALPPAVLQLSTRLPQTAAAAAAAGAAAAPAVAALLLPSLAALGPGLGSAVAPSQPAVAATACRLHLLAAGGTAPLQEQRLGYC